MDSELVYHYTTQAGLIGIIEKKEIWASNIQYLNDASEFEHARKIIESVCKEINTMSQPLPKRHDIFIKKMIDWSKNICGDYCYVTSFSEQKDLLSQWRAYTNNEPGFSVGIEKSKIKEICERNDHHFFFEECIYDQDQQIKTLIDEMVNLLNENNGVKDTDKYVNNCFEDFINFFFMKAPFFKNESFSEEKEWRIVSSIENGYETSFRQGQSMLIPYKKFPIELDGRLIIKELIVGPTPHMSLSMNSAWQMIGGKAIKGFDINPSDIPFRAW